MKGQIRAGSFAKAELIASKGIESGAKLGGVFTIECFGKDGKLKWVEKAKNVCTDEGINSLLNVMFHASTQITTWYVTLFKTDTTPAIGDVYAVPGYTEIGTGDVVEATRQAYVEAAASAKSISNAASKAVYTFTATRTIYGAALVGGGSAPTTFGDTASGGTLFCAAKFAAAKPVENLDVLNVTYTITGADA